MASFLAETRATAYFDSNMSNQICPHCGAELLPEVNFCRKCGLPARQSMSERTTAILSDAPESSTRRLEGRATSPAQDFQAGAGEQFSVSRKRRWAPVILIGVVIVIAMGTLAWAAFIHKRGEAAAADAWVYPGSQTVVDTTTPDGRAMHLRSADPFNKVVSWYTAKLKPAKTMQLTESIVVMRNGNITVTLGVENNMTSILVKESKR